mgnify:CR=1 FL=1
MAENKKMVKGKMRTVHKGKKGGKYYISKGKKVYFGSKRKRSESSGKREKKKPSQAGISRVVSRMTGLPFPFMTIDAARSGIGAVRGAGRFFMPGDSYRAGIGAGFSYLYPETARMMASGINMGRYDEPTYPDPRTGLPQNCAYAPDPRDCEARWCVRNPFSAWCMNQKKAFMYNNRRIENAGWTRQKALVRPRLKRLARRMRTKIDRRNAAAAAAEEARQLQYLNMAQDVFSRGAELGPAFAGLPHGQQVVILRSMLDELNPNQQRLFLDGLRSSSGSPVTPPRVPLSSSSSLFGKKKAKRNTKKKAKQTRK